MINTRLSSNDFLKSISTDNIESVNWAENECVSIPAIYKYISSNSSKCTSTSSSQSTSTSTLHNNPPILQSLYPILKSFNINTSNLKNKQLDVIYLKYLLSEVSSVLTDNNISMNLEKWGGRGKKY